jgi:hypothetical protein
MEILLALAVAFFGGPDRASDPLCLLAEKSSRAAFRLEGRFLGGFIRPGMTAEQVEASLREEGPPLATGGLVGGVYFDCWHYDRLGLTVYLTGDSHGVLRVAGNGVTFRPLFD